MSITITRLGTALDVLKVELPVKAHLRGWDSRSTRYLTSIVEIAKPSIFVRALRHVFLWVTNR